jgi:hypothetical protein
MKSKLVVSYYDRLNVHDTWHLLRETRYAKNYRKRSIYGKHYDSGQEYTKEKLINLGGERGMGKMVDTLVKFYDQQAVQSTIVGRLDSLSRAQDVMLHLLGEVRNRVN